MGSPEVTVTPELAAKITAARKAKGWSQPTLAKRIGVTQASVHKLENCQNATAKFLPDVLRELGLAAILPTNREGQDGVRDLLYFLQGIKAEHGIDIPDRHIALLRNLLSSPPRT